MKKVERDGMPREVAIELLATPGTHLTNRVRKNCFAALATYWEPDQEPKTLESKLPHKMQRATGAQLTKWAKRIIARRSRVQRAYEHCVAELEKKELAPRMRQFLTAQKAALDVVAGQLDAVRDAIETEIDLRLKTTANWIVMHHKNPAL